MGDLSRVVWVALSALGIALGIASVGCNDEKKPPLTPDGPEMTGPVGGSADGGDVPPAPTPLAAPTAPPAK